MQKIKIKAEGILFLSMCAREEELNSIMAFHQPFVFLATLLAFLVGLHFQALNISPIETHFAIILLLIIAAVVYSIAYASPIFQTHNTEYLPIFRLTCLASGILTCELLISLLISPLWWFLINLCISLVVEILRRWHQPIYNYVDQIHNWLQQKFQSVREAASRTFSLTQSTS
jgi:hypothetical protein